jgi:hypothetical protein
VYAPDKAAALQMYTWRTYSRVCRGALCQCGRHLITAPEQQVSTAGEGPRAVGALQVSLTRLACAAPNTALVRTPAQSECNACSRPPQLADMSLHCGVQAITSPGPSWRRHDVPWRVWQPCVAPLLPDRSPAEAARAEPPHLRQ